MTRSFSIPKKWMSAVAVVLALLLSFTFGGCGCSISTEPTPEYNTKGSQQRSVQEVSLQYKDGDANFDGKLTVDDLVAMRYLILHESQMNLTVNQRDAADINKNGKYDLGDFLLLMEKLNMKPTGYTDHIASEPVIDPSTNQPVIDPDTNKQVYEPIFNCDINRDGVINTNDAWELMDFIIYHITPMEAEMSTQILMGNMDYLIYLDKRYYTGSPLSKYYFGPSEIYVNDRMTNMLVLWYVMHSYPVYDAKGNPVLDENGEQKYEDRIDGSEYIRESDLRGEPHEKYTLEQCNVTGTYEIHEYDVRTDGKTNDEPQGKKGEETNVATESFRVPIVDWSTLYCFLADETMPEIHKQIWTIDYTADYKISLSENNTGVRARSMATEQTDPEFVAQYYLNAWRQYEILSEYTTYELLGRYGGGIDRQVIEYDVYDEEDGVVREYFRSVDEKGKERYLDLDTTVTFGGESPRESGDNTYTNKFAIERQVRADTEKEYSSDSIIDKSTSVEHDDWYVFSGEYYYPPAEGDDEPAPTPEPIYKLNNTPIIVLDEEGLNDDFARIKAAARADNPSPIQVSSDGAWIMSLGYGTDEIDEDSYTEEYMDLFVPIMTLHFLQYVTQTSVTENGFPLNSSVLTETDYNGLTLFSIEKLKQIVQSSNQANFVKLKTYLVKKVKSLGIAARFDSSFLASYLQNVVIGSENIDHDNDLLTQNSLQTPTLAVSSEYYDYGSEATNVVSNSLEVKNRQIQGYDGDDGEGTTTITVISYIPRKVKKEISGTLYYYDEGEQIKYRNSDFAQRYAENIEIIQSLVFGTYEIGELEEHSCNIRTTNGVSYCNCNVLQKLNITAANLTDTFVRANLTQNANGNAAIKNTVIESVYDTCDLLDEYITGIGRISYNLNHNAQARLGEYNVETGKYAVIDPDLEPEFFVDQDDDMADFCEAVENLLYLGNDIGDFFSYQNSLSSTQAMLLGVIDVYSQNMFAEHDGGWNDRIVPKGYVVTNEPVLENPADRTATFNQWVSVFAKLMGFNTVANFDRSMRNLSKVLSDNILDANNKNPLAYDGAIVAHAEYVVLPYVFKNNAEKVVQACIFVKRNTSASDYFEYAVWISNRDAAKAMASSASPIRVYGRCNLYDSNSGGMDSFSQIDQSILEVFLGAEDEDGDVSSGIYSNLFRIGVTKNDGQYDGENGCRTIIDNEESSPASYGDDCRISSELEVGHEDLRDLDIYRQVGINLYTIDYTQFVSDVENVFRQSNLDFLSNTSGGSISMFDVNKTALLVKGHLFEDTIGISGIREGTASTFHYAGGFPSSYDYSTISTTQAAKNQPSIYNNIASITYEQGINALASLFGVKPSGTQSAGEIFIETLDRLGETYKSGSLAFDKAFSRYNYRFLNDDNSITEYSYTHILPYVITSQVGGRQESVVCLIELADISNNGFGSFAPRNPGEFTVTSTSIWVSDFNKVMEMAARGWQVDVYDKSSLFGGSLYSGNSIFATFPRYDLSSYTDITSDAFYEMESKVDGVKKLINMDYREYSSAILYTGAEDEGFPVWDVNKLSVEIDSKADLVMDVYLRVMGEGWSDYDVTHIATLHTSHTEDYNSDQHYLSSDIAADDYGIVEDYFDSEEFLAKTNDYDYWDSQEFLDKVKEIDEKYEASKNKSNEDELNPKITDPQLKKMRYYYGHYYKDNDDGERIIDSTRISYLEDINYIFKEKDLVFEKKNKVTVNIKDFSSIDMQEPIVQPLDKDFVLAGDSYATYNSIVSSYMRFNETTTSIVTENRFGQAVELDGVCGNNENFVEIIFVVHKYADDQYYYEDDPQKDLPEGDRDYTFKFKIIME